MTFLWLLCVSHRHSPLRSSWRCNRAQKIMSDIFIYKKHEILSTELFYIVTCRLHSVGLHGFGNCSRRCSHRLTRFMIGLFMFNAHRPCRLMEPFSCWRSQYIWDDGVETHLMVHFQHCNLRCTVEHIRPIIIRCGRRWIIEWLIRECIE